MPQMAMTHLEDPATTIKKKIGKLDDIEIFGNYVLLGVYERPKVTKTGIHLADQTIHEDRYQGKAALVLKKGPTAFVSDKNYDFAGQNVEIDDWVAIFVSDGRPLIVRGQLCRLVEDQYLRMKLPSPDIVF